MRKRTDMAFGIVYVKRLVLENNMALTQQEREDVYLTVSAQLVKMFDILANVYFKPQNSERAQLVKDIEIEMRKCLEHFKMPD